VKGKLLQFSIHKEKSNKMQTMYQNFIIPYLYEAQHVSGLSPHHFFLRGAGGNIQQQNPLKCVGKITSIFNS